VRAKQVLDTQFFYLLGWYQKKNAKGLAKVFKNNILKLISNSSSLNKGNYDRDGVWIFDLNLHGFL